jgi:hypothetical protein
MRFVWWKLKVSFELLFVNSELNTEEVKAALDECFFENLCLLLN